MHNCVIKRDQKVTVKQISYMVKFPRRNTFKHEYKAIHEEWFVYIYI